MPLPRARCTRAWYVLPTSDVTRTFVTWWHDSRDEQGVALARHCSQAFPDRKPWSGAPLAAWNAQQARRARCRTQQLKRAAVGLLHCCALNQGRLIAVRRVLNPV